MNTSENHPTDPNAETYTVLIVDDNAANLGVLSGYLADYEFTTLIATDGELALKRAEYAQPDIILLDILMPGIDGFEVCRRLKENETTRNIPVIFMTALTETEDEIRGFQVGAVDYITKPFYKEKVLARIRTHVRLRELTERLEQRVQERTDELVAVVAEVQQLNQQLEEEIAERVAVETTLLEQTHTLQESEERLAQFINSATDSFSIHDSELIFLDINQAGLDMFPVEIKKVDVLGKSLIELVPNLKEHGWYDAYMQVIETRVPLIADDFVHDPIFGDRYLSIRAFKMGDGLGIIVRDITERKRTENLLRAQHDLALKLGTTIGLDETLRLCVETAIRSTEMDAGGVYLVDEVSGDVDLGFTVGLSPDFVQAASHYDADSPQARMIMENKPVYVNYDELDVPMYDIRKREGLHTIAVLPVHHIGQVI
ncbi:MAG: response regulator, partial [Proteobacteria bacterium]|nr:response regulator [Pseudomonadota bacterium]